MASEIVWGGTSCWGSVTDCVDAVASINASVDYAGEHGAYMSDDTVEIKSMSVCVALWLGRSASNVGDA